MGIILGMVYGNTLRKEMPQKWVPGIVFSTKNLLKIGVVLYGFRLTFTDIAAVGMAGFSFSAFIVLTTFIAGSWIGVRFFGLDIETSMLTAVGSFVCGAAAVLATEPVSKSRPYKSAMAVSTVVLFGTLTMFLAIPWFAVLFVVVVAINSLGIIPRPVVDFWNALDLFILTMAMCALGIETDFSRFRGAGPKPFYLAGILFLWVRTRKKLNIQIKGVGRTNVDA